MQQAIQILSSEEAKKTFEKSTTTFLQLASVNKHQESTANQMKAQKAYTQLSKIAAKFHSRSFAKIAVELKSGGHFDKVIAMVDDMMVLLRKEEQEDIEHRDRCENNANANDNELQDLKQDIHKTEQSLKRMENEAKELKADIKHLEGQIKETTKDMEQLLKFRNKEVKEFRQALKDDTNAVDLLKQAMAALSKYYKRNKIELPELVQKAPEYSHDDDKAPETNFAANDSRKSETGGIMAILEMLIEDVEKEMADGRADDDDAQAKYDEQNGALQNTVDQDEKMKANTEKELADLEEKMNSYDKYKNGKEVDQDAEKGTKKAIGTDCDWVATNFASRRDKRKDEMQGLVDAKAFLSGASALP